MKRQDLIRFPEQHGCSLLREGGRHSVYVNRGAGKSSAVPRHREINEILAREICRDLELPTPERNSASLRSDFEVFDLT